MEKIILDNVTASGTTDPFRITRGDVTPIYVGGTLGTPVVLEVEIPYVSPGTWIPVSGGKWNVQEQRLFNRLPTSANYRFQYSGTNITIVLG